MVWGSFLIAAAGLKTPTRNGCNAQGVNLTFNPLVCPHPCSKADAVIRKRAPAVAAELETLLADADATCRQLARHAYLALTEVGFGLYTILPLPILYGKY